MLSAGRHAKGSEASSWVGAVALDKVAGLAAHRFLSFASTTASASNSVIPANETSQTAKRFKKLDLWVQNPFRDFFSANHLGPSGPMSQ